MEKKMKKYQFQSAAIIIALSLALLSASGLLAQTTNTDEEFVKTNKNIVNLYDNSIGLRYSNISGYGLNYGVRLFKSYSVIVSGLILYNENTAWEDMSKTKITRDQKDILYNFGVELQRDMFYTNNTRVYALLGANYLKDDNSQLLSGTNISRYAVGLGFGLEWFVHERVSINISAGYKFDSIDKIENKVQPSIERKTGIGIGGGVTFQF
jgi:hypothetical protein